MNSDEIDPELMTAFLAGELSDSESEIVARAIDEDNSVRDLAKRIFCPDLELRSQLLDASAISDYANEPELLETLEALHCLTETVLAGSEDHPPAKMSTLEEGECRIGDYEVLEVLKSGGMGILYRVRHRFLKQEFALKVIAFHRRNNRQTVFRFQREVALNGELQHPNLVRTVYAGEHRGMPFLVMELVEGKDLSRIADERGKLSVPDACEVIRQAAICIDYLGSQGVVHRDIKPSNLILTTTSQESLGASGELEPIIKVLDLGLTTKTSYRGLEEEITITDQVLGTIDYLAPEQAIDSRGVDTRADVYALGCTL